MPNLSMGQVHRSRRRKPRCTATTDVRYYPAVDQYPLPAASTRGPLEPSPVTESGGTPHDLAHLVNGNSFPSLRRQHCRCEAPKSLGIFRIESIRSDTATKIIRAPVDDAGLTTILEIPPSDTLELPRCCKQDRRCGALLSCLLLLRWRDEFAAEARLRARAPG
jgi:hypothetical protein